MAPQGTIDSRRPPMQGDGCTQKPITWSNKISKERNLCASSPRYSESRSELLSRVSIGIVHAVERFSSCKFRIRTLACAPRTEFISRILNSQRYSFIYSAYNLTFSIPTSSSTIFRSAGIGKIAPVATPKQGQWVGAGRLSGVATVHRVVHSS